jgi:hypothetical protein
MSRKHCAKSFEERVVGGHVKKSEKWDARPGQQAFGQDAPPSLTAPSHAPSRCRDDDRVAMGPPTVSRQWMGWDAKAAWNLRSEACLLYNW